MSLAIRLGLGLAFASIFSIGMARSQEIPGVVIRVEAGEHDRRNTPIQGEVPPDRIRAHLLGLAGIEPEDDGAEARLRAFEAEKREADPPWRWRLFESIEGEPPRAVSVEAERVGPADSGERHDPALGLSWILDGETPAGSVRRFELAFGPEFDTRERPWSLGDGPEGSLELKNRERTVFRYNRREIGHPDYPEVQRRSAYIHPAFTPSGVAITGDYSPAHPHHRGFFLAYARANVGPHRPDFWNIHQGTGKIYFERLGKVDAGPVRARFEAEHRWEVTGAGVVLRERWEVCAYDIPDAPYWLFDLTSTQRAEGEPLTLEPYRYGGMAYRGPDSFLPRDVLDVLTSQGLDRRQGDQKPARWVDLTGPVADGSSEYAGAMIADHPQNPHHPTVARIHPTTLPFFCFVPSHDEPLIIGPDEPQVFRYRVLIHDGRPSRELDERIWRDFAEPPRVVVEDTP